MPCEDTYGRNQLGTHFPLCCEKSQSLISVCKSSVVMQSKKDQKKRPAFCKSVRDQLRSKEGNLASRIGLENKAGKETKMDGCVPQSITQGYPELRTLVVRKRIHPEFT